MRKKTRARRTSRRSFHFENVAKRFINPDLGRDIGQQVNGMGDLANTRENEKWCFFRGPARVLIQERETTAEGVRMTGVWITEVLLLFDVLFNTCVSESEKRLCNTADTEAINFQDLVRRLLHSTFLDLTTQIDAPDDAWEEEITGWDPRSTRDPSKISSFWRINLMQHHVWDPI